MGLPIPDQLAVQLDEPVLPEAVISNPVDQLEARPKAIARGATGARITEKNAELLAFAAAFPGATTEAFSVLNNREATRFAAGGELPTIGGTEKRLEKLVKLGALRKTRRPGSTVAQYGITKAGVAAAYSFGHDVNYPDPIDDTAFRTLVHYRFIAHVAAQLISPKGFFRNSLGIEPVSLGQLRSEKMMRATFDPVRRKLKENAESGKSGDFGRWRDGALSGAERAANERRIGWSDIVEAQPALLTIGAPQREGTKLKAIHQPDIAVILDGSRTDRSAKNILVEVELSKKSWTDYDSILATLKREFDLGTMYERAVYFTNNNEVSNLIRRVDASYGLIGSGKLTILPLLDRNGNRIEKNNRVPREN